MSHDILFKNIFSTVFAFKPVFMGFRTSVRVGVKNQPKKRNVLSECLVN